MSDDVPSDRVRLTVGGVDLSDLVRSATVSASLGEASTADLGVHLDVARLSAVNLRGDVSIDFERNGVWVPMFRGVVTVGELCSDMGGAQYVLRCKDPHQLLAEYEMRGAFGSGMNPTEIIYYLLMLATPQGADKAFLSMVGEEGTLADSAWRFASRRYLYIAPLPMCRVAGDERLTVAGATVYAANGLHCGTDDSYIASAWKTEADTPAEWTADTARARLYVQAHNFLEAFDLGRERLRKLVDYLSFAANFSTPTYPSLGGYSLHPYSRDRTLLDAGESAWAYVRDIAPLGMIRGVEGPRTWLRWFTPHRSDEPLVLVPNDPSLALCPALHRLLEVEPEHLTRTERNILSALHALRRARQATYPLDGLHHLFQCMEFLVNTTKMEGVFTEQDRLALRRVMETVLDERYPDLPHDSRDKRMRKERVAFALSKLDEPTLKVKWARLCADCEASISELDQVFLFQLRKTRNEDVHGGVAGISRSDVERGAVILEKAIAAALIYESSTAG